MIEEKETGHRRSRHTLGGGTYQIIAIIITEMEISPEDCLLCDCYRCPGLGSDHEVRITNAQTWAAKNGNNFLA